MGEYVCTYVLHVYISPSLRFSEMQCSVIYISAVKWVVVGVKNMVWIHCICVLKYYPVNVILQISAHIIQNRGANEDEKLLLLVLVGPFNALLSLTVFTAWNWVFWSNLDVVTWQLLHIMLISYCHSERILPLQGHKAEQLITCSQLMARDLVIS